MKKESFVCLFIATGKIRSKIVKEVNFETDRRINRADLLPQQQRPALVTGLPQGGVIANRLGDLLEDSAPHSPAQPSPAQHSTALGSGGPAQPGSRGHAKDVMYRQGAGWGWAWRGVAGRGHMSPGAKHPSNLSGQEGWQGQDRGGGLRRAYGYLVEWRGGRGGREGGRTGGEGR